MSQTNLGGRLGRWSLKLQAFNFTIEHRKGSQNVVPDALSRMHVEEIVKPISSIGLHVDLDSQHFKSEQYEEIKGVVQSGPLKFHGLRLSEPHLYYRSVPSDGIVEESPWKLWVPAELTSTILEKAHCPPLAAHCGIAKTTDLVKRYFFGQA